MTDQALTNLSTVEIKIDGKEFNDYYLSNLEEVVVETVLNMPAMATIRLQDPELEVVVGTLFKIGGEVEIKLFPASSYDTSGDDVFKGEIVAIEPVFSATGNHLLVIRAYDKAYRLFFERRTQTYENMTDSAIADKIGGWVGLQTKVESSSPTHKYVLQYNQTDMAFLSERARKQGYLFFVKMGVLNFVKATTRDTGPTIVLGEELRSFRPRQSVAQQHATYTVLGWDSVAKRLIKGEYSSTEVLWTKNGVSDSGGKSANSLTSNKANMFVIDPSLVASEANQRAEAAALARESDYMTGDGVAFLAPKIQAGVEVKLEGLGDKFDGTYFVTSATHYFDAYGGETHFSVTGRYPHTMTDLIRDEEFSGGAGGRINGVVPGVVTSVDKDEENLLRVRVKFPWMPLDTDDKEIESNWARIAAPYAGKNQGFFFMPEMNDEVLVAFEHGDVNQPYIIGRLWNNTEKPAYPVADLFKEDQRIIHTKSGHFLRFNDSKDKPAIEIRDSTGRQLFLIDTAKKTITIEAESDIDITSKANIRISAGKDVVIEAKGNIKGKATQNIELAATSVLKGEGMSIEWVAKTAASMKGLTLDLKGDTSSNLQAGAAVTIKGAIIQLN